MFAHTALLSALLLAVPPTGPLAELDAALARLGARDPVKAGIEQKLSIRKGDKPPGPEGTITANAAAGPEGLELRWARASLEKAAAEDQRAAAEPDAPTPTRDTLATLDALATANLLDAAPPLRKALADARLLEDRADSLDGQPARLLVLELEPVPPAEVKKYVKEMQLTARIWLGPDGLPLAAERKLRVKGRALLVMSFEMEEKLAYRFARAGDRLVTVSLRRDTTSEGLGDRTERHLTTSLTVTP